MYHKYLNNTGSVQHYRLPNETFSRISELSLAPNGTVTLSYPGLDNFVPHMLAKITEDGMDISDLVVRARKGEVGASVAELTKLPETAPLTIAAPEPVVEVPVEITPEVVAEVVAEAALEVVESPAVEIHTEEDGSVDIHIPAPAKKTKKTKNKES